MFRMSKLHWARAAAALAVVCVLATPAKVTAQPPPSARSELAKSLGENPVFGVLEAYYPATYKAALDALEQGMAKGQTMAGIQSAIRDTYVALLSSEMPKAEGTYVLEAVRIGQRQAEAVASSPADCMTVLGLLKMERIMQNVIPAAEIEAEQAWAAAMLRQTATRPVQRTIRPLPPEKLRVLAITAYDGLSSDDARMRIVRLAGKFAGVTDADDQRAICEFSIQYSAALLAMPTVEAVDTFLATTTGVAP
jgi:hypothetical protein